MPAPFAADAASARRVLELLDDRFLAWARELDAREMVLPATLSVRALARIDYFRRFPHEAVFAAGLAPAERRRRSRGAEGAAPGEALLPSGRVLVPAACYPIYLALADSTVADREGYTGRSLCFRNRPREREPFRLVVFPQRKIAFVGTAAEVRAGLARVCEKVLELGTALGLGPKTRPAPPEPGFEEDERQSQVRRLFAHDEEIVDGELALAHTNFHRDSYTRRLEIRHENGRPAAAGCVGLEHETWLEALDRRYAGDGQAVVRAFAGSAREGSGSTLEGSFR